jgi:hypothetical protein
MDTVVDVDLFEPRKVAAEVDEGGQIVEESPVIADNGKLHSSFVFTWDLVLLFFFVLSPAAAASVPKANKDTLTPKRPLRNRRNSSGGM